MYKILAQGYFKNANYTDCLMSIKYACELAYTFNWVFTDEILESLVYNIAKRFNVNLSVCLQNNRIVLYDNFAMSNRGLTQQYLRALINLNYEILLIITRSPEEIDTKMRSEIASYSRLKVAYVPLDHVSSLMNQIETIITLVMSYRPTKAFLHMAPWDVVGNVVWNALSFVERYQINLTDHAFWLGTKCSDYVLEFRNYGYNLSMQMRHIPKEKLLILPYYPIYDTDVDYQGIPEPMAGAIKLFSGGSPYKIHGDDFKFVKIVNDILLRNPNTIFYFAGAKEEDVPAIISIIKKQGLNDRWILLGNRSDIVKIMANIDIYIATYPIGGGLMAQIAAAAAKPIVCYEKAELCGFTGIQQQFDTNPSHKVIPSTSDLQQFNTVIDNLIQSSEKRTTLGKLIKSSMFTQLYFENRLASVLNSEYTPPKVYHEVIATDAIFKLYMDIDNNCLHQYYRVNINSICLKNNLLLYIKCITLYCYYNWKRLLYKFFSFK